MVSWLFLVIGITSSVIIYFSTGDIFRAVAVFFILVWLVIFLRFFLWAVYHYNINYGITQKDWDKIEEAKDKLKRGLPVTETELQEPDHNPYRSQTFGLPPGTVRGMIAFTLLFGAVTILIASMGMDKTELQNSLLTDQFEFFKTAFLMMIAFYFGDKSLRYLQKRWRDPNKVTYKGDQSGQSSDEGEPVSQLDIEDEEFVEDEKQFASKEGIKTKSKTSTLTGLKNLLKTSAFTTSLTSQDPEVVEKIIDENKFVERNLYKKVLSDENIRKIIADLKEKDKIILQYPVLKSIIQIESGGSGHLPDGRCKILFEGHKFWYWLNKLEGDPGKHVKGNEDILYEKWTRKYYKGGAGEYLRLERAMKINKKAAIYSTSWGLFQILGENLTGYIKSRINPDPNVHNDDLYAIKIDDKNDDFDDFIVKQDESERYHLLDFLAFIKTKQIGGKSLIEYISGNDEHLFNWEKFAYGYNGSGYKVNNYDLKLKNAYNKFLNEDTSSHPASKIRIPIIDAGHGGIVNNAYVTPGKRYKFTGAAQKGLEIFEGVVNRKIAQKLIEKLKAEKIQYYDLNSTDQNDMSLSQRVKIADKLFADNKSYYYLSIHSNSSSNSLEGTGTSATGFEIFTSVGQTQSDLFAKVAAQIYQKHFPKRKFRGIKEEDYSVLKKTDCPAFLVENLFFDNFDEAKYLMSEKGQDEIAACLLEVVKSIS